MSSGPATAIDTTDIQLSIIATSRNDNHGGSLTARMQHFVDGFVAQCKRHALRAELILVEWNPPKDRVPLIEELRWPADAGSCDIRIITVPSDVHHKLEHADKIPLFQMIAKNVGIRRARGRFVLATNVDILFSDGVIQFMRDHLRAGVVYRTTRVDVPAKVPHGADFGEVLRFCHDEAFRIHGRGLTVVRGSAGWSRADLVKASLDPRVRRAIELLQGIGPRVRRLAVRIWNLATSLERLVLRGVSHPSLLGGRKLTLSLAWQDLKEWACRVARRTAVSFRSLMTPLPFTNGCGDFTLLSRSDWFRLRGYAEWQTFSWHLDSLLMYQAVAAGVKEKCLTASQRIFHIEHGKGYTPEAAGELFSRLSFQGIPFLTDAQLQRMRFELATKPRAVAEAVFNDLSWGMGDTTLPETCPAAKSAHRAAASETLRAFN